MCILPGVAGEYKALRRSVINYLKGESPIEGTVRAQEKGPLLLRRLLNNNPFFRR